MKTKTRPLSLVNSGLSKKDYNFLKSLNTPSKIQNYINSLPFNFEKKGETSRTVEEVLKANSAHCFEGALVGAASLWINGDRPLILDLRAHKRDLDHVVTLFSRDGYWGAISKTNHGVLRFREPVYKTIRELAMSYFHEYFLSDGAKTLRSYSKPYDLSKVKINWFNGKHNLFDLSDLLDKSPHTEILNKKQIKNLRKADKIETEMGQITEW